MPVCCGLRRLLGVTLDNRLNAQQHEADGETLRGRREFRGQLGSGPGCSCSESARTTRVMMKQVVATSAISWPIDATCRTSRLAVACGRVSGAALSASRRTHTFTTRQAGARRVRRDKPAQGCGLGGQPAGRVVSRSIAGELKVARPMRREHAPALHPRCSILSGRP